MNYQEWRHSASSTSGAAASRVTCRPRPDPCAIASVLGDDRTRLARHTFLGGNAFMLRLMNRFRDELRHGGDVGGARGHGAGDGAAARSRTPPPCASSGPRSRGGTLALDVVVHESDRPQVSDRLSVAPRLDPRDSARPQGRTVFESGRVQRHRTRSTATTAMPTPARSSRTTKRSPGRRGADLRIDHGHAGGRADDRPASGDAVPQGQPAAAARLRQADGRAEIACRGCGRRPGLHRRRRSRALPRRGGRSGHHRGRAAVSADRLSLGAESRRPTTHPSRETSFATTTTSRRTRLRLSRARRRASGPDTTSRTPSAVPNARSAGGATWDFTGRP